MDGYYCGRYCDFGDVDCVLMPMRQSRCQESDARRRIAAQPQPAPGITTLGGNHRNDGWRPGQIAKPQVDMRAFFVVPGTSAAWCVVRCSLGRYETTSKRSEFCSLHARALLLLHLRYATPRWSISGPSGDARPRHGVCRRELGQRGQGGRRRLESRLLRAKGLHFAARSPHPSPPPSPLSSISNPPSGHGAMASFGAA